MDAGKGGGEGIRSTGMHSFGGYRTVLILRDISSMVTLFELIFKKHFDVSN